MCGHPGKDQIFIAKLSEIILANLGNEDFGVNELVKKAGISHYSINRRLKAITNKSIKQFIREVRLQKALEILQNEEVHVSEVAYKVGFGSPAYFNTCFHDFFGFPPGAIKKGDYTGVNEMKPVNVRDKQKKNERQIIFLFLSGILVTAALAYLTYHIFFISSSTVTGTSANNQEKSIAVLPFKNLSNTDINQHFIDGVMEEILDNLSKIRDLRVVSRTSVEQYRNNVVKSLPEIARELKVNYIVEGSVKKYDNNFILRIKLIKAGRKETPLWAETYNRAIREPKDIYNIQSQVAQVIATELKAVITPEEKILIEKVPTVNLNALDFYQLAREEERKFSYYDLTATSAILAGLNPSEKHSVEIAEKMYRNALKYDSAFALAYTGLAGIYWRKNYSKEYFSENFLDSVPALANKALSYDDQLPDAHYIIGMYAGEKGNIELAIKHFDKALKLNPNYWLAYYGKGLYEQDYVNAIKNLLEAASRHHGYGLSDILENISYNLSLTGFSKLARSYILETIKLKPDSTTYYFWQWMYEFAYEECFEFYKKRYSIDQTDLTTLNFLASYYEVTGQFTESLNFYKKWLARSKEEGRPKINEMQRVGYSYSRNGLKDSADLYFNKQIEYCNDAIRLGRYYGNYTAYYDLAGVYSFTGDKIRAYENLKIFDQKSGRYFFWIIKYIKDDPLFDSIRNEPQFQEIVNNLDVRYQVEHERVRKWLEEQGML